MGEMVLLKRWKEAARGLKLEAYTLYVAYRDPRVPWYARFFMACVVAYAFSPIDLIPDPIPVLGYLDDLVLIPLGIVLARQMVPPEVLADARERAKAAITEGMIISRAGAAVIVGIWISVALLGAVLLTQWLGLAD